MDDLDDAAGAVAGKKRSEHGLRELQIADDQEPDAKDAEDDRAGPVGEELQRDVEEARRQVCGLIDLLQGVGHTEHQHELGDHEEQEPALDLESGREPPQPRPSRRKPSGHLARLQQRLENVQSYSGTTLH